MSVHVPVCGGRLESPGRHLAIPSRQNPHNKLVNLIRWALLFASACCLPSLLAQSKKAEDLAVGKILVTPHEAPDPLFAESVIVLVQYSDTGRAGSHDQQAHYGAHFACARGSSRCIEAFRLRVCGWAGPARYLCSHWRERLSGPRARKKSSETSISFPGRRRWRKFWRAHRTPARFGSMPATAAGDRISWRTRCGLAAGISSIAVKT